jgi:putative transcriptional regulator
MTFQPEDALSRLSTGAFLVARDVLRDPNFEGTVVLLCAHESDGDYGLVLNRASNMPLDEVFESLPPEMRGPRVVHIGGPVEQDKIQILDWSGDAAPESQTVVPGLTMGGHWNFQWQEDPFPEEGEPGSGKRFHQADPSEYRIFLGYSGWSQGQLTSEIELGAWQVFHADIVETLKLGPDRIPKGEDEFATWAEQHPPRLPRGIA